MFAAVDTLMFFAVGTPMFSVVDTPMFSVHRYKLINSQTYPTFRGHTVDGVKTIISGMGFDDDVKFRD